MREGRLVFSLLRHFMFGGGRNRLGLRRIQGGVWGIALSLIPLTVVFVVANGMIDGITMRFIETGTYHLQLILQNEAANESVMQENLLELDGVLHAFPEVQGLGLLAGGRGHGGVLIRGLQPKIYEEDLNFSAYINIVSGSFNLTEKRSALIGEHIASTLEIDVGDEVRIITAEMQDSKRFIPRIRRFTVTGIISSGYRELDALWVFISHADAKRIIPQNDARKFIGIKVSNPFTLDDASQNLNFIKNSRKNINRGLISEIRSLIRNDWYLFTWFDLEQGQYMSFITTRNLLFFITILILFVATVNISSTMIMLVLEKQEEIAMLKAMGIRNYQILIIFLIAGGITGGIGAVIGLALGALAAYNINEIVIALEYIVNGIGYLGTVLTSPDKLYVPVELFNPEFYLSRIPINLHFSDLGIMALTTLLLSIFMSYLPAHRAVRLNPLYLLHRQ